VVIALLHGFVGGLMFWILGLPSPVFWGAMMAFLSFLPILGAFVVYLPAGAILLLTGSPVKGIVLIVVGTVVVGQIDNIVRPLLVSGKTGMHTMLLFVSIMGGVSMFGLLGIVLGPFVAAVFISLYEVFRLKMAENGTGVTGTGNESPPTGEGTAHQAE
jgi:predicted PurR-regulated permease PerM